MTKHYPHIENARFRNFEALDSSACRVIPRLPFAQEQQRVYHSCDHIRCISDRKMSAQNVHAEEASLDQTVAECQSNARSSATAEWVSEPMLMRSTPVAAIAATLLIVTFPEASSFTFGAN